MQQPELFVADPRPSESVDPLDAWREAVQEEAREFTRKPVDEWPRSLRAYFDSRVTAHGWVRMPPTWLVIQDWIRAGKPSRWKKETEQCD